MRGCFIARSALRRISVSVEKRIRISILKFSAKIQQVKIFGKRKRTVARLSQQNLHSELKMSDYTIENHDDVTMKHELRVNGRHLIEKKQITWIHDKTLGLVYIRSIDDKSYKVTSFNLYNGEENAPELQIETDMTEDEVKKFEEDWANLWNPDISKNEIWELLHYNDYLI